MNKLSYIFLSFLLIFSSIHGYIIEHDSIEHIMHHLKEDDLHEYTLIIFDIDNTVAETEHMFGGDQWFMHEVNQKVAQGLAFRPAVEEVLPEYIRLQKLINLVSNN